MSKEGWGGKGHIFCHPETNTESPIPTNLHSCSPLHPKQDWHLCRRQLLLNQILLNQILRERRRVPSRCITRDAPRRRVFSYFRSLLASGNILPLFEISIRSGCPCRFLSCLYCNFSPYPNPNSNPNLAKENRKPKIYQFPCAIIGWCGTFAVGS